MKNSKLLKSGLIYTIGNLLVQGLAFITLPIYTRVISQEVFGHFSLYTSWVSIISLFIGLQLSGSLSIGKKKYEDKYDEYTVNIFTLSNIIFLIIFFLVFIFKSYIAKIIDFDSNYILIIFLQSYFGYLSGFFANYFLQLQKTTINFILSFFSALVNTIISLTLIYFMDNDFLARVIGNIIPALIVSIITIFYFYNKKNINYKISYLKFGLAISIPLIFHHLGHNILNQFDRIMIGKMMSSVDVALYSFAYSVGLVIQIVLNSINMTWIPWFFGARKNNYSNLQETIQKYLSLGVFLTLGYLTIFPELALIMGGERYSSSLSFISLIIISYFFVFLYTFPVNIQFYYENTKFIPFGTLIAGILNIGLNFILIPLYGIYGAALATVFSYIFLLIIHHTISKKMYNYKDVSVRMYIILSFIVVLYSFIMNYFINSILIRWTIGIMVLICYTYYYRSYIYYIIISYKK